MTQGTPISGGYGYDPQREAEEDARDFEEAIRRDIEEWDAEMTEDEIWDMIHDGGSVQLPEQEGQHDGR